VNVTKLDDQKQELEKNQVQRKKCFIKVPGVPIGIILGSMHIGPPSFVG
jgi:hypothetical protein